MSNIKTDLLKKISLLGYGPTDISKATKIPAPRIYSWYRGDGLPKAADFNILKLWLESITDEENSGTISVVPNISSNPDIMKLIAEIEHLQSEKNKLFLDNFTLKQELQKQKSENEFLRERIVQLGGDITHSKAG